MAITKLLSIKESHTGYKSKHLKQAIDYITAAEKTGGGRFVSAVNCQPSFAYEQMKSTKELFHKTDKRQGYHIIISFEEGEVTPKTAFKIIGKFVEEYLGDEYEAIYAVHDNTDHIHGHIIYNSVSFMTGKKYRYEKGDWGRDIQPITNRLCIEYGLSTIKVDKESPADHDTYIEWKDKKDDDRTFSKMIRRDIDACIIQADDYEEFIRLMKQKGYQIKQNKYLAVKPPGMKRYRRTKFFGEGYSENGIRRRITEENLENYRRDRRSARIVKVNVPYHIRRAKLSGIQRRYYKKLYKLGMLKAGSYSQAWKYKDDIRKMHSLHEKYMFLAEYEIHDTLQLKTVKDDLIKERRALEERRRAFFMERNRFKELKALNERLSFLTPAEVSFQNGDTFFEKEHIEFENIKNRMSDVGYTPEEIDKIDLYHRGKAARFKEDFSEINKKIRIAEKLLEETSAELTRDKEKIRDKNDKTRR